MKMNAVKLRNLEARLYSRTVTGLIILWLGIVFLGSFWLTVGGISESVSTAVIPEAPIEGESIMATFKLNNPSSSPMVTTYQYAYENPLPMEEQLNFMVRTQSERGSYERVSFSAYPPQAWSSFISFASFSTSVMSSTSTMSYYQSNFSNDMGLNLGILITIVLIALLIFLELTQPVSQGKTDAVLSRLRIRFSTVTWILLIIFTGIVCTKVVTILAT